MHVYARNEAKAANPSHQKYCLINTREVPSQTAWGTFIWNRKITPHSALLGHGELRSTVKALLKKEEQKTILTHQPILN